MDYEYEWGPEFDPAHDIDELIKEYKLDPSFHLVGIGAKVTLEVDGALTMLRAMRLGAKSKTDVIINELAELGVAYLKTNAPEDTGNLKASIYAKDGAIYGPMPLGKFLNDGTDAHIITPNSAKVLSFTPAGSGFTVFSTKVSHPGTHATYFIDDTVDHINQHVSDIAEKVL
jgi:hypothetical protein